MSIAGDWGTGTEEAEAVAESMLDSKPHYTVHLGDVYYCRDNDEVNEHCLKTPFAGNNFTPVDWPHCSETVAAGSCNSPTWAARNVLSHLCQMCRTSR